MGKLYLFLNKKEKKSRNLPASSRVQQPSRYSSLVKSRGRITTLFFVKNELVKTQEFISPFAMLPV